MFVIELIYKVDLAQIDAHMAAHVKFLKKYYAAGHFLVSGRKIPRDGGIILAVGTSRSQIEAIVQEDPFAVAASQTRESSSSAPVSAPPTFSSESTHADPGFRSARSLVGRSGERNDRRRKLARLYRLRHVHLEAGLQGSRPVGNASIRRQGRGRDAPCRCFGRARIAFSNS